MAHSEWGERPGFVLDTGALIELQKWGAPLFGELKNAQREGLAIIVPTPVLVEWLAGGSTANVSRVMDLVDVVELDEKIAKAAGAALVGAGRSFRLSSTKVPGWRCSDPRSVRATIASGSAVARTPRACSTSEKACLTTLS
jgi:predicted nucleic acid-binding protein